MRERIGVLGGTFDPIHQGHLDLGAAALDALPLDGILVVPSNIPPHRPQPAASSHHRFAMAALATTGLAGWRLSDVELEEPGVSYTSTTLRRLHQFGFRAHDLVFILGADAFAEIESWYEYPDIFDLAHFAVVSRPGFPASLLPARLPALAPRMTPPNRGRESFAELQKTPDPLSIFLIDRRSADVSSTAIRERLARGDSIAGTAPAIVCQYIEQQQLYTNSPQRREAAAARPDAAAGRLHGQD